jgi:hypothetical protein
LLFSLFSTELSADIIVFPQKPLVSATLPSLFPAVIFAVIALFSSCDPEPQICTGHADAAQLFSCVAI